jgi:spore coat protein H
MITRPPVSLARKSAASLLSKSCLLALFAVGAAGCTATAIDDADKGTGDDDDTVIVDACGDPSAVGWTAESHAKGVDGNYDLVFDDDRVMRLDLTFCASDRVAMLDDLEALLGGEGGGGGGPGGGGPGGGGTDTTEDPLYVPVVVSVDGQSWPWVGVRYKGNSSLGRPYSNGSMKLPFRLNFDKYEDEQPDVEDQRFHGFKELKFSNADLDGSLGRDKLTSDTLRAAGLPAAKGGFVEVWADGGDGPEYWGLYSMFEDPAGELLDSWFGDDNGNMYKADGDAAALTDTGKSAIEAAFEGKGGAEDHTELVALAEVLANESSSAAAWRADLEAVLDVDGFLSWLALDALIGNWDTYGQMTHNFYFYADPSQDGRLVWIAWDFNEAYRRDGTRSAHSIGKSEVDDTWPLIRRLMDDPVYAARYGELLEEHMEGAFEVGAQQQRMADIHALIGPSVEAEAAPFTNLSGDAVFETALEGGDDSLYDILDEAHELGWAAIGD